MLHSARKPKLWTDTVRLTQEDELLRRIMENDDKQKWSTVAKRFAESCGVRRTPKQCRDRWVNNISCVQNDAPWSDAEVEQLFQSQLQHGNQWSLIAREIKGRSENQIKNMFYSTIRRNIRKFNKGKFESERIKFKSLHILNNQEIRSVLTAKKSVGKNSFAKTFLSKTAIDIIKAQFVVPEQLQHNGMHFNHEPLPLELSLINEENCISSEETESKITTDSERPGGDFAYADDIDDFLSAITGANF
jgi:hypothetical protein